MRVALNRNRCMRHNGIMGEQKIAIDRTMVGIIALTCLLTAAVIFVSARNDENWVYWQAAFTRVGLVMAAFWLALPSRHRDAAWANVSPMTLVGLFLTAITLARFKLLIPVVAVLVVVGLFFRPKKNKRPGTRPR